MSVVKQRNFCATNIGPTPCRSIRGGTAAYTKKAETPAWDVSAFGLLKESVLHRVQHGSASGGKVDAALQVAGVGRAQRAVAADLNGAALGKAAGRHDHLIGVARLHGRFGAGKAVNRAVVLDARTEARQRLGTARIKAGHNVVVVGRVARHGVYAHQLQQALGVDSGFQGLAHHAGGVVEPQEGVAQAVLCAAQIAADTGCGKAVAAFFHQVTAARNVAARGGDAAAGVLDKAAGHQVSAHSQRLADLGEFAVAVVHEDDRLVVDAAHRLHNFFNRSQIKRIALGVAAAALDMHHRGGFCLFGNVGVVGGKVRQQRALVVVYTILPQGAAALARLADADHALQRVVGAACGGQQGVARAQQAEQCHRQRVGAAHKLRAHQRRLGSHAAGKDLLQLIAAVVPDAVAAAAPEMAGLDAAIGEGAQHFKLVEIPDLLDMGKLLAAKGQRLLVQRQNFGFQVVELFDHKVFQSVIYC